MRVKRPLLAAVHPLGETRALVLKRVLSVPRLTHGVAHTQIDDIMAGLVKELARLLQHVERLYWTCIHYLHNIKDASPCDHGRNAV